MRCHWATWILLALAAASVGCGDDNKMAKWVRQKMHPTSADDIQQDLTDRSDPDRRRQAILKLSHSKTGKSDTSLQLFAEVLRRDPDAFVRSAAATALGKGRNPTYADALIEALDDRASVVRWDAAVALDRVIVPQAAGPLIRTAAYDSLLDVRVSAVRALRNYHKPDVVRALIARMDDPELTVRHEAHKSLMTIFGTDFGSTPADWDGLADGPMPPRRTQTPWWRRWNDGAQAWGWSRTDKPTSATGDLTPLPEPEDDQDVLPPYIVPDNTSDDIPPTTQPHPPAL
ncbi:hypothetical protein LCGC14_0180940 [marine sediment metagenome]|uniref:HEAT repeat domain-containing protein n=1 Tax=marine sediment metagenome TaxID=412755 RepID=A0A0F9X7T0_9ZZZZ